jgi:hypothetical protein
MPCLNLLACLACPHMLLRAGLAAAAVIEMVLREPRLLSTPMGSLIARLIDMKVGDRWAWPAAKRQRRQPAGPLHPEQAPSSTCKGNTQVAAAGTGIDVLACVARQPALLTASSWALETAAEQAPGPLADSSHQGAGASGTAGPGDDRQRQARDPQHSLLRAWEHGLSQDSDAEWSSRWAAGCLILRGPTGAARLRTKG